MATFTVSSSQNFNSINGGNFQDFDRITLTQSAVVTIDTDTPIIERVLCNTLGELRVVNPSVTNPILVKTGEDGATATAQLRFEAGAIMTVDGSWIEIGVSDGSPNQTFTLPLTESGQTLPQLPTIFSHILQLGVEPFTVFNRADNFTDAFGDEKFGTLFTHTGNTITLGDGFNGYIPPAGSSIRIPSVVFADVTTGTGYTDFDFATSGTADLKRVLFCDNYGPNFSSSSSIKFDFVGFGIGREDFNISATFGPSIKNMGWLGSSGAHLMSFSASPDIEVDNVFIYNYTTVSTEYPGFFCANSGGGTIKNSRVVVPFKPQSTNRGGLFFTSSGIDVENCFVASQGPGIVFSSGSGNSSVKGFGYNASGSRDTSVFGAIGCALTNCADITLEQVSSYPLLPADGAVSPTTYFYQINTGVNNVTITDADIYCGEIGDAYRTNNPFFFNATNTRTNDIRLYGHYSSDTINFSTSAANNEFFNIRLMNGDSSAFDIEWTDGSYMDLVASTDAMDNAPSFSGSNVRSIGIIESNTNFGRVYKPFGRPLPGFLNEITLNGNYFFDNAGKLFMSTAGDVIEVLTGEHYGITGFDGIGTSGVNTGNFTIRQSMRSNGGPWSPYLGWTTANLNANLATLNHSYDMPLEFRYEITRDNSNLTDYLYSIRVHTLLEPGYVRPFIVDPLTLTMTGVQPNSEIRIFDHATGDELAGVESLPANEDFTAFIEPAVVDIVILSLGFINIFLGEIDVSSNLSIPIQQQVDRQYMNM